MKQWKRDFLLVFVLFGAAGGWVFWGFHRQFTYVYEEFPKRHAEVTTAVRRIFAFHRDHGRWPEEDVVKDTRAPWLPPDW